MNRLHKKQRELNGTKFTQMENRMKVKLELD